MSRLKTVALPRITEAQFMLQVISLAKLHRWMVYHTHDSRRSQAGFPDLVLVRERVLWLEVKTDRGRIRPEQQIWLDALNAAGQEAWVVRPADWSRLLEVLQ